ncbi:HipA family kinase [Pseudonocardia sp. WMMC193]|uniref:HipA family kinase n=1 Tax=Pseudonocardia sp. WMMC193 TaxID=2911965 RepID=UPI001F31910D|nr:HipA family kinase [Pseudonocardia sp. WMMC193]MCF7548178.1 aminotransferase class I and II [Pseudonocardia sp. WMMC193]
MLRHVTATRYVAPLREGGSLPGLMEADDLGTYVVKFHGAGQGRKVLVAEIVVGELARTLGFAVPELVTVELDPDLGLAEPDQEVQELLRRSPGLNLGLDFLPGALDFDPLAFDPGPEFAGRVLWFDALVGNVDRSWRNSNMLLWHRTPYLIDHGATLTFHHAWTDPETWARRPFDAADHVLLGAHPDLDAADAALAPLVTADAVRAAVAQVPDAWLDGEPPDARERYVETLVARVAARDAWLPGVRETAAAGRPRPITREGRAPAWLAARLPKARR